MTKEDLAKSVLWAEMVKQSTPQLLAEFDNFDKNTEWLWKNEDKLREKYADKFVAVYDKKVCFAEKNLEKLAKLIRAKYGDDRSVVIDYISKERQVWLL